MCKGLAIITEKIDDKWIVYTKEGESSHDKILHELRDDLRYGKLPHLKFEVVFPNQIHDDIIQDCEYPSDWIEIQFGKKIACKDAFKAVSEYIYSHQNLLNFNKKLLSNANLRDANLNDADLSGVDLSGADLSGADLNDADLSGTDLSNANLRDANLRGTDLSNANLRNTNLHDTDLSGADLRGADLRDANLRDANLNDANLSNANLRDANLSGADLSGTDLRGTDLRDANLEHIIGYKSGKKKYDFIF